MQKYLIAGAIALAGLVGAFMGIQAAQQPAPAAQEQSLGSAFATNVRSFPGNQPATTTRAFLASTGAAAAQSFIIPTEEVDLFDLNLVAEASTTATVFRWTIDFSSDYNNTTGVGTWYCADAKSVAIASTTHSAACHEHQWTPGTVATSTKNVSIEPNAQKFSRINFYATGAAGALHADAVLRKPLAR